MPKHPESIPVSTPHVDEKSERVACGLVLAYGAQAYLVLCPQVRDSTYFWNSAHRKIWLAAMTMLQEGSLPTGPESMLVIASWMQTHPASLGGGSEHETLLEAVGGHHILARLTGDFLGRWSAGDATMAQIAATSLAACWRRRTLARAVALAAHDAGKPGSNVDEIIDGLNTIRDEIGRKAVASVTMAELAASPVVEQPRGILGLWGLPTLDKGAPLLSRTMNVLAAGPGGKKTSLALLACAVTARMGTQVGFISLEMTAMDLYQRLRKIDPEPGDWLDRIAVTDLRDRTVAGLRTEFDRMAQAGTKVIIVDFLQKVQGDNKFAKGFEVVSQASSAIAQLTKDRDCTAIVLSQLTMEGRKQIRDKMGQVTGNREPSASDLRGSGDIEQDADTVILMWPKSDVDADPATLGCKIAKNRYGKQRTFEIGFTGHDFRVFEKDREPPPARREPDPRLFQRPSPDEDLFPVAPIQGSRR